MGKTFALIALSFLFPSFVWADGFKISQLFKSSDEKKPYTLQLIDLKGTLNKNSATLDLELQIEVHQKGTTFELIQGPISLVPMKEKSPIFHLHHRHHQQTYDITFTQKGTHQIQIQWVLGSSIQKESMWRESSIKIAPAELTTVQFHGQQKEMELQLPTCMKVQQQIINQYPNIKGLLKPGHPLTLKWKGLNDDLDGRLVLESQISSVLQFTPGGLKADHILTYRAAQGEMQSFSIKLHGPQSITKVLGSHIREWKQESNSKGSLLNVSLNQKIKGDYILRLISESPLKSLPTSLELPKLEPLHCIRSKGHLAVGTNHALHLSMNHLKSLQQIDPSAFPKIMIQNRPAQRAPSTSFYYTFKDPQWNAHASIRNVESIVDALSRQTIRIFEDNLVVYSEIELDIREAPLKSLDLLLPKSLNLISLKGHSVNENASRLNENTSEVKTLNIQFNEPVLGRTLLQIQLETGESPLSAEQLVEGLKLKGIRHYRGWLALVAQKGVGIQGLQVDELKRVHVASLPMKVDGARHAWRTRGSNWTLRVEPVRRRAGIHAEALHLITLDQNRIQGSVALNYFISNSPIDRLHFRVHSKFDHLEFVGKDVRRWEEKEGLWTVYLSRKVIGEYNLGCKYAGSYEKDHFFKAGSIACDQVETQSGTIAISSHLSMSLEEHHKPKSVLALEREEISPHYRLLIRAPLLKAYRYSHHQHELKLKTQIFPLSELLSAVAELGEIDTRIEIGPDGKTESLSTGRWHIKNSTAQFFKLRLPEKARIWQCKLLDEKDQTLSEMTPIREGEYLKIPLSRRHDPNQPLIVEVSYGLEHGKLDWQGRLDLQAPKAEMNATFTRWTISSNDEVHPNLAESTNQNLFKSLSTPELVLQQAWFAMKKAIDYLFNIRVISVLLVLFGALLCIRIVKPHWSRFLIKSSFLLLWFILGLASLFFLDSSPFQSSQNLELEFAFGSLTELSTPIQLLPFWRAGFNIYLLTFSIALLFIGLFLHFKKVSSSFTVSIIAIGIFCGLSMFPPLHSLLLHIILWGSPLLLLLLNATALIKKLNFVPLLRTAGLGILFCGVWNTQDIHSSESELRVTPLEPQALESKIEAQINEDHIELTYHLVFPEKSQGKFLILSKPGLLNHSERKQEEYHIIESKDGYHIDLKKHEGKELRFKAFLPLQENQRKVLLKLPGALSQSLRAQIEHPGWNINISNSLWKENESSEKSTISRFILQSGEHFVLIWEPGERRTDLEHQVAFADQITLWKIEDGQILGEHGWKIKIAKGEINRMQFKLPKSMSVTRVQAKHLAVWNFDPENHHLELRFSKPLHGTQSLSFTTQQATQALPYRALLKEPQIEGIQQQKNISALLEVGEVIAQTDTPLQHLNKKDFLRSSASLNTSLYQNWKNYEIKLAHNVDLKKPIRINVHALNSEYRSEENSSFSLGDERLIYNSKYTIDISRVGVFYVDLLFPKDFDIDHLDSSHISHWDEKTLDQFTEVRLHLMKKHLGKIPLNIALSKAISQLPKTLTLPRLQLKQSLRHRGQIKVSSERGHRWLPTHRTGVSELDTQEGQLLFKLLSPQWKVELKSEQQKARQQAEALHRVTVVDGGLQHRHDIRYTFFNAGVKEFLIHIPSKATGVVIKGSSISDYKPLSSQPGLWRVELDHKWYQPYLLSVHYSTSEQFNESIKVSPLKLDQIDLWKGWTVLFSKGRLELEGQPSDHQLFSIDSRSIPKFFSQDPLTSATLAYSGSNMSSYINLKVKRHQVAERLEARVLSSQLQTLLSKSGTSLNRLTLKIENSGKRDLQLSLPSGSTLWTATVDGRPVRPSTQVDQKSLMIPLGQSSSGSIQEEVVIVYRQIQKGFWNSKQQQLLGPQLDLPLENFNWQLYCPKDRHYDHFQGNLNQVQQKHQIVPTLSFNREIYQSEIERNQSQKWEKAKQFKEKGNKLAREGKQLEARKFLETAYINTNGNVALNEDTRVELQELIEQQTVVGLWGARNDLAERSGARRGQFNKKKYGDQYRQEEAEHLQNSLDANDNSNLEIISASLVETQSSEAQTNAQIDIHFPEHGIQLDFQRRLQIDPSDIPVIQFQSHSRQNQQHGFTFALFFLFLILFSRVSTQMIKGQKLV